ncbi:MAG TPA: Ig-like domain-containing protein, partial [Gemmatimonadales bacterium]|nr:Ig-like domain-containing protein [Gemmatimonadales bacterium]
MRVLLRLFQVSWIATALACGSDLNIPTDPADEAPAEAAVSASRSSVTADPTKIVAGSGVAVITVTARDDDGNPIEGAIVSLQGTGTDITLTQPTGVTGANGMTTGTLQSGVPGFKVVSAMINGTVQVSQTAQVEVVVLSASRLELVAGDDQTAPVGTAVPIQPAVRVLNSQGQPVPGYGVSFAVTSGGGTVNPATQTTDAAGIARVAWA